MQCSKCSRFFVRLDTHLRNRTTCRVIPYTPPPCALSPTNATATLVPAIFAIAQCSNAGRSTSEMSKDNDKPLTTTSLPPQMKGRLLLPTSPDATLVPSLLLSPNPQEINRLLVDGIYSYFSTVCGSKTVRADKEKKRPLRNATLKDVMKKEAKSALRRARKKGLVSESIGVLAKQFFSLVRSHNQLKKASEAQRVSSSARKARQQYHLDFQRYAKEVLEEGKVSTITPIFSAETAHDFFSQVYGKLYPASLDANTSTPRGRDGLQPYHCSRGEPYPQENEVQFCSISL